MSRGYIKKKTLTNVFTSHKGYFEQADKGTIFLDEISELALGMQVKLLRVLEKKYISRIGGEKEIPVNVRVIAASNRELRSLMREGKFRQDLYYRLAVWPISIPPLCERKDDIKALANYFLRQNAGDGKTLSHAAIRRLYSYDWPGNVRELESCILRTILCCNGKTLLGADDMQLDGIQWQNHEIERRALEEALRSSSGSIKRTSRLLGVHRNTVYNKAKKFGIDLLSFRNSKPMT